MTAITFDDMAIEPISLERRIDRLKLLTSYSFWAEVIALADGSLELVREMRGCVASCTMPAHFDACLTRTAQAATSIPVKTRKIYGSLPWYFWFAKRKAFQAADEWEDLAEDLSFIATAERRKSLDSLVQAVQAAKDKLPSWRDSDLFQ